MNDACVCGCVGVWVWVGGCVCVGGYTVLCYLHDNFFFNSRQVVNNIASYNPCPLTIFLVLQLDVQSPLSENQWDLHGSLQ